MNVLQRMFKRLQNKTKKALTKVGALFEAFIEAIGGELVDGDLD